MALYSIIDVETTGGNPQSDFITEIAIIVHDGEKVVDTFQSLVNPQVPVPDFITRITGIDNDMLRDAPKFYEIARQIVEMTEGAIFVAHNARFDYSFIQKEFRRLGFTFTRKQLCTVKWSRKLIPGLSSYSLKNLCGELEIENPQAHRAMSDTQATTTLFEHLLRLSEGSKVSHTLAQEVKDTRIPPNLNRALLDELPEEAGVYYFLDKGGNVLYVGKSTHIRKRVLSHFSGAHKSRRTMEMINLIHDLSWEICGNDLIAMLHENEEIKRLQPPFNRAQRRKQFKHGIYQRESQDGYIELFIDTYKEKKRPIAGYGGHAQAEAALKRWGRHFQLCPKRYDVEKGSGRCFHHQLHICLGACVGAEPVEEYNARVLQAISVMSYGRDRLNSFLVIGKGRQEDERSVVYVEMGTYQGHTFLGNDELNEPLSDIAQAIPRRKEAPDVQRIIQGYVRRHPQEVYSIEANDSLMAG